MQVEREFAVVVLANFTRPSQPLNLFHFSRMYSFSPSPRLRFAYICQWLISELWGGHNVTSVTSNVARAQRESAEIRHAALRMKKFSSGVPFPVTFLKLEQGEFC